MKQNEQSDHVERVKLAKYSIRRRFKKWHVVFTLNGKLYERSTRERCERKARKRAKEIYEEIMNSKESEEKTYKMETPHGGGILCCGKELWEACCKHEENAL